MCEKDTLQQISNLIDVAPNFPLEGIFFRDIGPLLANSYLKKKAITLMIELISKLKIDVVAGLESRGFIFGNAIADELNVPFVMMRKPNKMPDTISVKYGLEYGSDVLTIQKKLLSPGMRVLIVDDLLATGGSFEAGCRLIELVNCTVVGCLCLVELVGLDRTIGLDKYPIISLLKYPAHSSNKFISKNDELYFKPRIEYLPFNELSKDDEKVIVFSHPTMDSLANDIINLSPIYRKGYINWEKFDDGFPNIKFEEPEYLQNKKVIFVASLHNTAYFLEQLSMIMVLSRQFIEDMIIIIPRYGPATMERVDEEGTLATAETTAKIFSSCLELTKNGPPQIMIFDIHNVVERFYFANKVIIRPETAIELLKKQISGIDYTIVFPDQGAHKRFKHLFKNYRIIICMKDRNDKSRKITICERYNWPQGCDKLCWENMLIVDDLVQSGGTLEECRKALVGMGAKQVSAYVTHAVFPKESYKKFLKTNDSCSFNTFYITDSIPEIAKILEDKQPFFVIKLGKYIGEKCISAFNLTKEHIALSKKKTIEFNVYVASTNKHKNGAVYSALKKFFDGGENKRLTGFTKSLRDNYNINVYGVDVSSDVSNQPIGDETIRGCENRLGNLKKYVESHGYQYDMLIGIENGVEYTEPITDDTKAYDFCYVEIIGNEKFKSFDKGKQATIKAQVNVEFLRKSLIENKQITCGTFIEQCYGYSVGAWHEKVCGVSRFDIIAKTVSEILNDIE